MVVGQERCSLRREFEHRKDSLVVRAANHPQRRWLRVKR